MRRNSENRLALFMLATAAYWASLYLYVPILSPYTEVLGGSLSIVGLVVSSYGFTQLLLRIPSGIWSDRLGRRKPFMIAGFVTSFLAGVGLALAPNPWTLLVFRGLSGVAATMWVAITVLYASYFPADQATRAMGVINFVTSSAQVLASFIGGLMADAYGWTAPFTGAAVIALAGFAFSLGVVDRTQRPKEPQSFQALASVGRTPLLLIVSGLAVLSQYVTFSTVFGFTPVYAVLLGASKADLGTLSFVSQIPAALGSLLGGTLLLRWLRERTLLWTSFLVLGVSAAAIPFAQTLWQLNVSQAAGGLARGVLFPLLMGMAIRAVSSQQRSTAMGYFQSIYSLGMFVGPLLSGVLGDRLGLLSVFWVAGAVGVVGSLLAGALLSEKRATPSSPTLAT